MVCGTVEGGGGGGGLCGLWGSWESVGVVMLREFPLCKGRWREWSVGQWRGESGVCVREGKRVGSQWVL